MAANDAVKMPTPAFRLIVDGVGVAVDDRLESLTLTDNRGMEADTLDITLLDHDGALAIPSRGNDIYLSLGWQDAGLCDKGRFTVDEAEHSGSPDKITIRAKSADLRTGLSTKREASYHETTIGTVVATIAGRNGLTPKVASALAGIPIKHIDQTAESDINFLTRLAKDHDAITTVKKGGLLFLPKGASQSASGVKLSPSHITRRDGDQHRFTIAERGTAQGVRAYYYDTKGAAKKEVIIGKGSEAKGKAKGVEQSADELNTLRHTYASKASATRAARAEWQRIQRGKANLSLSLARGRPDIGPESPVTVSGFKPEIDGAGWLVVRATHTLSSAGLVTSLEMELGSSDQSPAEQSEPSDDAEDE